MINKFRRLHVSGWLNRSLFSRTLISIMVITIIIMVIASTGDYYIKRNDINARLVEKSNVIARRLENSIRIPLWNLNFRQIDTILDLEMQDHDIVAIVIVESVVDIPGKVKVNSEIVQYDPSRHASIIRSAFYKTVTTVSFDDKYMGDIEVYYTNTFMKNELYSNLLKDIGIILLFGIVVFFVEFFVLRYSVLNPIQDLQRKVGKIAERKFDTRIDVHSKDEIGKLAVSFNEMIEQIENYSNNMEKLVQDRTEQLVRSAKLASLGSMVTGVAHEINTPVGVCLTAVTHAKRILNMLNESIERQTLKRSDMVQSLDSVYETLGITEINLKRTAELVESFKQVAGDREQENRKSFNIKEIINRVLEKNHEFYADYTYEVTIDCDDDFEINNYPKLLQVVLEIFLSNSLNHGFSPDKAFSIHIRAWREERDFFLEFTDNGKGIRKEFYPRIFDPFFTTSRSKGSKGLGLNIAYNIVTYNMNGSIECESIPFESTTFRIEIPGGCATDILLS